MRFHINDTSFTTELTTQYDFSIVGSDGWSAFFLDEFECQKAALRHVNVLQATLEQTEEDADKDWDLHEEGRRDYNLRIRY